ncbi:Lipid transfer protein [Quillaja saponaria]|uniref:Lipid transfer protein n=1 Tax=Quillaja saponaria TaxID=32244 RepID=A0AAD7M4Z0_QUISA|nr:Lipid transfer protein [Quillaja saponaria]
MAPHQFHYSTIVLAYIIVLLASALISPTLADSAKDRAECAEQLTGIATCLPYVGGDAKSPTLDCCTGLKQAFKTNKKCICLIVKDHDDPDLGLKINVTLALGLPTVCKTPDNISQCPALLHLDPKSPEAQVFNQVGKGSNTGGSASPAPTPTVSPTSGTSKGTNTSSGATSAPETNEACYFGKRYLGLEILVGLLILFSWN